MYYNKNSFSMYYERHGNGIKNILILPGWGDTRCTFQLMIDYLKSTYSVGSGDDEDTAISKDTETEMKTLMNSNLATITGWKQVSGGYPVFDTTNN